MMTVRIAGFAGSLRRGSYNRKLLESAAEGAREVGAEVEILDLREYEAPLYDADIETEHGLPESVLAFKERIHPVDGLLIASPENNGSVSSPLKNALDWASRPTSREYPEPCFPGKTAAVISASPGRLGGIRGLSHLRSILLNLRVHVIPNQYAVQNAHEAFAEDGTLLDERSDVLAREIGAELVRITRLLKADS